MAATIGNKGVIKHEKGTEEGEIAEGYHQKRRRTEDDENAKKKRKIMQRSLSKVTCDFYEADGSNGSATHVLESSLTALRTEQDPLQICSRFGSALAAYLPSIKQVIKDTLQDLGAILDVIYLPKDASDRGVVLDANDAYDVCDAHVIMSCFICILFKNISERSFTSFMTARMQALGGKLGMLKHRIRELGTLVSWTQAEVIRGKMGDSNRLKQEILLYLMEFADARGCRQAAARYLCMILSWNEMTSFIFVYEELYRTASPVLKEAVVRKEVVRFAEAESAVGKCKYPQFFRYFCTGAEERLIQRNRFPTLAAVAQRLKNTRMTSSTTVQTTAIDEKLVQRLVEKHVRGVTMANTNACNYLIMDRPVGFDEEDES